MHKGERVVADLRAQISEMDSKNIELETDLRGRISQLENIIRSTTTGN